MSRMWRLGWIVGALSGAIACPTMTLAQSAIVPDATMGNQPSQVIQNFLGLPVEAINGGAQRGQNLFHSLREFNVDAGRSAYFFVPNDLVRNILTRVTGSNPSRIFGTMGTFQQLPNGQFATAVPNVNLFLLNPNGILFGPGAQLDVGGSFVATTTNGLKFGNLGEFSATDPQPPSALLTINPSAFFVNRVRPRPITVNQAVLAVPTEKSLLLLGGDVSLNNASFVGSSPGSGQVELGGITATGQVNLAVQENKLQLGFLAGVERGDVTIANGSRVDVLGETGGSLAIYARNLDVSGSSQVIAGISSGSGTATSQAGDILLDATGDVTLRQSSFIRNLVGTGATGNSGNVVARAKTFTITGGSVFGSRTFGTGNAGNVWVTANTISLDGFTPNDQFASGIFSTTQGRGQGGDVTVQAGSLFIRNGAVVSASTFGIGNAGNVRVIANTISLDGFTPNDQFASGIFSATQGRGQGGDMTVQAGSLSIRNGAVVSASTFGTGNAGNVQVTADAIVLDGTTPNGSPSAIASQVGSNGRGQGGDVIVQAGSLSIRNGAIVSASMFGIGDAGNVRVDVDTIVLDGTASGGGSSGIVSEVGPNGRGQGSDVTVQAGSLSVRNGARVSASTFGIGDAGNVWVDADIMVLDGTASNGDSSGIVSEVASTGRGRGGDVTVQAGSLSVRDGASVSASTGGIGDAGNVWVTAETISLDGTTPNGNAGGIASAVAANGRGQGGDVTVEVSSLIIRNGANISASTDGIGDAGNVWVTAETISLDGTTPNRQFGSGIGSQVRPNARGQGGDVTVEVSSFTIGNGATVSASTFGIGDAGNVRVAAEAIVLDSSSEIASQVGRNGDGNGGNVQITTDFLSISNGASVSSTAFGNGSAGNLNIAARNIFLNRGLITSTAFSGDGANIILNIRDILLMRNGSQVSTSAGLARGGGDGGNITIDSPNGFIVGVLRENSDITANAFTGSGGNVTITAQGIYGLKFQPRLTPNSDITASSEFGFSGTVTLNIPDTDPSRGFISLPVDLTDPTTRLDTRCQPGSRGYASSYIETGRGGVPQNPEDPLIDETVTVGWAEVRTGRRTEEGGRRTERRTEDGGRRTEERNWEDRGQTRSPETEIIEAQAIGRDRQGHLWLVAKTNQPKQFVPPECQNQRP